GEEHHDEEPDRRDQRDRLAAPQPVEADPRTRFLRRGRGGFPWRARSRFFRRPGARRFRGFRWFRGFGGFGGFRRFRRFGGFRRRLFATARFPRGRAVAFARGSFGAAVVRVAAIRRRAHACPERARAACRVL